MGYKGGNNRRSVRIIELNLTYESQVKAARAIEGSVSGVNNCLRGLAKTYKGFHFEYVNPEYNF